MPATFCEILAPTKSEPNGSLTWEPATGEVPWVAGILTISGKRSFGKYRVEESSSGSAAREFSLFKTTGETAVYHCTLTAGGLALSCSCKGFEMAGRCKHLSALQCLAGNGQL